MTKFMKVGRVAIVTRGRHAGKKVVLVQPQDSGTKADPFAHAIVAGVARPPKKLTKRMGEKRQRRHSRVKAFVKKINYIHLMPTRYTLELEGLKGGVITHDTLKDASKKDEARKLVKKAFEDRFATGKNKWFFTPLRF